MSNVWKKYLIKVIPKEQEPSIKHHDKQEYQQKLALWATPKRKK